LNLRNVQDLVAGYKPQEIAPPLRKHVEHALATTMGMSTRDDKVMMYLKHVAVSIWLFFTAAAGVTAFGSALHWWAVDSQAFLPIWSTFGVGFAPLITEICRQAWKKQ
jgi:hypothetical protein